MFGISFNLIIIVLSALAAGASFAAFAIPFMNRKEQKERFREVIEKKRKALFEQAREQANNKGVKQPEVSAAKSMALLYRFQQIAGEASMAARLKLNQAGIRDPMAPIIYLVARIVLPIVFLGIAMLILSMIDKEIKRSLVSLILLGAAFFGFYLPYIIVKNTADKRQQEISLTFPDSLDMLLICVQGGIGIEAAINRIAETVAEQSGPLGEELGILSAELGMLNDRKAAFQGFASRVGSGPAKSFATAMLQAEQYGTSISKALRVLADESRDARMAAAEQKAASLPPKLTVPMILFFLPALFIVILGPAFIKGAG